MENINIQKETWYNENITWKVAKKFKEIISKKWEHIMLKKNLKTNEYLNKFEYNGRELSTRTVYQNSEVWDFDIWEWTHCISLWDVAVCPEFLQAIREVEKDEWVRFRIWENIWLSDCLVIIWKEPINLKKIANDLWLRDVASINTVLVKIKNDLSVFLNPEFEIMLNDIESSLFVRAEWERKQDIINKSPLFMGKLQKITQYLDEHMNEIIQSFKNLASEEQKKNEEIKKEQEDRLNSLQNQL